MNIRPKTARQIDLMREGGKRLDRVLRAVDPLVARGTTLTEIDNFIHGEITQQGGIPSFIGHQGYKAASCLSVNSVIVHGLPDGYELKDGDVVGVDVGMCYGGMHTDAAVTKIIGLGSQAAQRLVDITQQALRVGIEVALAGNKVNAIGQAIENYVQKSGSYGIVRDLTGHGVGQSLWEPPEVPNYFVAANDFILNNGLTLAIEPMITTGDWRIRQKDNQWPIATADGSLAAHFETTIVICDNDPEILVPFPLELAGAH